MEHKTSLPQIPLIIINLKHRQDRLQSLNHHIQSLKEANRLQFIESITPIEAIHNKNNPSVGCMASHRKALQLAQEKKWPIVMVIEDDARFTPACDLLISQIILDLPPDFIACFGGSCQTLGVSPYKKTLYATKPNDPRSFITSTHCMLYGKTGYQSLINMMTYEIENDLTPHMPHHVDLLLCFNFAPLYLTVPFIAMFCASTESDVRKTSATGDLEKCRYEEQTLLRLTKY
jgi:hypothetical protein